MRTRVLARGQSGWGVKLTTYLYLVPRLRIGGVIRLLPIYAFMIWTGENLQSCNFHEDFCCCLTENKILSILKAS